MYREGIYRFFSFSYVDVKCALIGFDQATAYIEESEYAGALLHLLSIARTLIYLSVCLQGTTKASAERKKNEKKSEAWARLSFDINNAACLSSSSFFSLIL